MKSLLFAILLSASANAASLIPGDSNGDGRFTMSDVVFSINYIFGGGPAPVPLECPTVYFLFDDVIPQVVETYYLDTNWIWWDIGGHRFYRAEDIVRRVYLVGPDSQPCWYFMVPDTARYEVTTTMMTTRVYLDTPAIIDDALGDE